MQTTDHTEDAERDRWRNLFDIAAQLAEQQGRTAVAVRHAARWLDQHHRRLSENEIVVTWSVADAELIRHQLRDHLPRDRVFPAAPRVRRSAPDQAASAHEIPEPRDRRPRS